MTKIWLTHFHFENRYVPSDWFVSQIECMYVYDILRWLSGSHELHGCPELTIKKIRGSFETFHVKVRLPQGASPSRFSDA